MKFALATILAAFTASLVVTVLADDTPATGNPYEVKNILRATKVIAYVDNGWKDHAPGIQAELHVTRELDTDKPPYARAYFFDRENKLIQSFKKPVEASDDHKNYSSMPVLFKPHQPGKVWFPISEKATQTGERWARVIIVFGDENHASAEIYPKDDLSKFDFPEKDLVIKSAPPVSGQTGLK